jgi:hypothetical protein
MNSYSLPLYVNTLLMFRVIYAFHFLFSKLCLRGCIGRYIVGNRVRHRVVIHTS